MHYKKALCDSLMKYVILMIKLNCTRKQSILKKKPL